MNARRKKLNSQQWFKHYLLAPLIIVAPLWVFVVLLNYLPHPIYDHFYHNYLNLKISLDDSVPLIPMFAIPYLLSFVWWGAAPFFINGLLGKRAFMEWALIFTTTNIISFILFLSVPTLNTIRPQPTDSNYPTGFMGWLFDKLIYGTSKGYHLFPFGHALWTVSIMLVCIKRKTNLWLLLVSVALTVLIILSSLFIKQHLIVDPIASLGIAVIVWLPIWLTSLPNLCLIPYNKMITKIEGV